MDKQSKAIKLFALIAKACHAFEKIGGSAEGRIHFSYKEKKPTCFSLR